jgi:hypothetical protein
MVCSLLSLIILQPALPSAAAVLFCILPSALQCASRTTTSPRALQASPQAPAQPAQLAASTTVTGATLMTLLAAGHAATGKQRQQTQTTATSSAHARLLSVQQLLGSPASALQAITCRPTQHAPSVQLASTRLFLSQPFAHLAMALARCSTPLRPHVPARSSGWWSMPLHAVSGACRR